MLNMFGYDVFSYAPIASSPLFSKNQPDIQKPPPDVLKKTSSMHIIIAEKYIREIQSLSSPF